MRDMREKIRGSLPALITPMKDGAIDEAAFRKFVSWQIAEGISRAGADGHDRRIGHRHP